MKKYLLLILMLHFVSVIHAQITISMHIDYIQNNDTILKDTIVPYLRINFQNNTDTAQYFVLNNYEKYPNFSAGAMLCYTTPEEFFANKNKFEYMKCDDKHYVYIHNNSMDILHIDLRTIGEEEFPEEFISSDFSKCYDILRKTKLNFANDAQQIILLNPKQSYNVCYNLIMCALVCGEYEFIFEMTPPAEAKFPDKISNYYRCKRFIGQMNLLFKP